MTRNAKSDAKRSDQKLFTLATTRLFATETQEKE